MTMAAAGATTVAPHSQDTNAAAAAQKKPKRPLKAQDGTFGPIDYKLETAVVEGRLVGATDVKAVPAMRWVFQDAVTMDEVVTDLTVMQDGTFRGEARMWCPARCVLSVGESRITFFAGPGEKNVVVVDLQKLQAKANADEVYSFEGRYAGINSELSAMPNPRGLFQPAIQQARGKSAAEYKQLLTSIYDKAVADLEKGKASRTCKDLMKADWQVEMHIFQAKRAFASLSGQKDLAQIQLPADYYNNLLDMHLDQNPVLPYTLMNNAVPSVVQLLADECEAFKPALESLNSQPIVKARSAAAQLSGFEPFSEAQKAELQTTCPQFYACLLEKNAELETRLAENAKKGGYRVLAIEPELKGEDVFKAIVEPFKGKPVLVDFWATWCGPCRRAMDTIKPLKEELAGKVAFVYVSSPTSPEGLWKNMIADIHGDHYYVTEEQWTTLLQQFESQGIPTYVVVDKDGNVKAKHIGFPGVDTLREELKN